MKTPPTLRSIHLGYYYSHGWRVVLLAFTLSMISELRFPVYDWVGSIIGDVAGAWLALVSLIVLFPPIAFLVGYAFGWKPQVHESDLPDGDQ